MTYLVAPDTTRMATGLASHHDGDFGGLRPSSNLLSSHENLTSAGMGSSSSSNPDLTWTSRRFPYSRTMADLEEDLMDNRRAARKVAYGKGTDFWCM